MGDMRIGQKITVRVYGGKEVVRRVIAEGDDFVVICREEKFQAAKRQGRPPQGVGCLKRLIVDTDEVAAEQADVKDANDDHAD